MSDEASAFARSLVAAVNNLEPAVPFVRPPRLPPELLQMIMDEVGDPRALRRCCLAGPDLLPHARRALFSEVKLFIGPDGSDNLDKMLECYTTRPYAQYAKSLVITYRGVATGASHALRDYRKLQKIVTLLSTCLQRVDSRARSGRFLKSKISSLRIEAVSGSRLDFARIIRGFPEVTKFVWRVKEITEGNERAFRRFLSSAPSPAQIQDLEVARVDADEVESILFPPATDVCLRSFSLYNCDTSPLWSSIISRSGNKLEQLSVSEMYIDTADGMINLSANARLKSVALQFGGRRLHDEATLNFAIPTLHSVASEQLETVVLDGVHVHNHDAIHAALSALDKALTHGPSGDIFNRFQAAKWHVAHQAEVRSSKALEAYMQSALEGCWRRGILYDGSSDDPL